MAKSAGLELELENKRGSLLQLATLFGRKLLRGGKGWRLERLSEWPKVTSWGLILAKGARHYSAGGRLGRLHPPYLALLSIHIKVVHDDAS